MMLTQKKVNEVCQMLKRDGNGITIAKVRALLDKRYSFFTLADKVILFKNDPKLAQEVADKELKLIERADKGLFEHTYDAIESADKTLDLKLDDKKSVSLLLAESLQSYIDQSIEKNTNTHQAKAKKIQLNNDHMEVQYFGLRARYQKLLSHYNTLKDEHYHLEQAFQNLKAGKRTFEDENADKERNTIVQMRDVNLQLSLLKGECCAGYDPKHKQIVVKLPAKHKLIKELEKGVRSIHLRANAVYDFASKLWLLDSFEAKTINLLTRNNFVISKELALVLRYLESQQNQSEG